MTTEKHPITQLEEITKTLKSRRFSNLDLDQVMIAVHLLNNLLVRIDIEKTPAIKAAAEFVVYKPGQTADVRIKDARGEHWQRTTILDVRELHKGCWQYLCSAFGRSHWTDADQFRNPVE